MRLLLLVALAITSVSPARAAVLDVGPGFRFETLSKAARAAHDGDEIRIHPGTYRAGARFTSNRLTIAAAAEAGPESVVFDGGVVEGKGILLLQGADTTVEGLTLSNARAGDGNGAGIRAEGKGLTVRNVHFRDNEIGLLITPLEDAKGASARISNSLFDGSGTSARGHIGHALYAAHRVGELTVENSIFRRGRIGHYLKSRAERTVVTGSTIDDSNGEASYLIDIPQGGSATIENNRLIKGPKPANCCVAIAYGAEMAKGGVYVNPPGAARIANNEFVNLSGNSVRFVYNLSIPPNPVALVNNKLLSQQGRTIALDGEGTIDGRTQSEPLRYKGRSILFEADRMVDRGWLFSPVRVAFWLLGGFFAAGLGALLLRAFRKGAHKLPRLRREPKPPMHPSARPGRIMIRGKRYRSGTGRRS